MEITMKELAEELGYREEVIEGVCFRYANTVLSDGDLDNLQWAKDFIDNYRKKHESISMRKQTPQ